MPVSSNLGRAAPIGATVIDNGVNFSLFSRSAAGVELLFFDREDDVAPSRVVRFDPVINRTYHYWFELPELRAANSWREWIDTSLDSPDEILVWNDAPTVPGHT